MKFIYQFLIGIALVGSGALFEIYTRNTVNIFGEFPWTNKYFGAGGTYTFFRLLGLVFIILGFLFMFGFMRGVLG
jgi:uncharacterized membrane protein YkgB